MHRLLALIFLGAAAAQQFKCPLDDGYYRDPSQCDKYYDCYRGEQTEKLCPDGLVFDEAQAPRVEQCSWPFIVNCNEGSTLQPAQPSGIECPRQYGYFEHEDPTNCREYYECTGGVPVLHKCHTGLVFDEFTGVCQWAHAGFRAGCIDRNVVLADGFACPNQTQIHTNGQELDHARYANPSDCRFFYVCQGGDEPREVGCPQGTVFNTDQLICDAPENVPECADYYPLQ